MARRKDDDLPKPKKDETLGDYNARVIGGWSIEETDPAEKERLQKLAQTWATKGEGDPRVGFCAATNNGEPSGLNPSPFLGLERAIVPVKSSLQFGGASNP